MILPRRTADLDGFVSNVSFYATGTMLGTNVLISAFTNSIPGTNSYSFTWSNIVVQQSGAIGGTEGDRQFGSVAFQNGGNIIEGWMNAICCGNSPTSGNFNKYHWARSMDGGVTFPFSGTIATDTRGESVAFNGTGPAGFRWSPQVNVAGDPVDGTLYAV